MAKRRILVVEDEGVVALNIQSSLESLGYEVPVVVASGEGAIQAMESARPDLVLLDIMLEGEMDGVQAADQIRQRFNVPVVFLTAYADDDTLRRARVTQPFGYLLKPFDERELHTTIEIGIYKHRMEAEREKLVEELEAFAHTVAHDLKTPLSLIVGYAHLLKEDFETMPDQDKKTCAKEIARHGHKASSIISELLLLAQVRKADVTKSALDMAVIVDEALSRLGRMVEENEAEIVVPSEGGWPTALGYAPWVEEIWVNYLSNAIKYGGQPPRVALGFDPPDDGRSQVRFWVRDNGAGLAPEEQARLFKAFSQLDPQAQGAQGHGLGLSIVQRIVDKLDGQAGVESEGVPGQGSLFFFTLPAARS